MDEKAKGLNPIFGILVEFEVIILRNTIAMKKSILLFASLLFALPFFAQLTGPPNQNGNNNPNRIRNNARNFPQHRPSFSIGLSAMEPLRMFADNYQGIPFGISAQIEFPTGRFFPIELGGDFAWFSRGGNESDILIYEGEDSFGNEYFGDGTIKVRSNIYSYAGFARLNPIPGPFQVYGDLILGVQNFSTKTIIESNDQLSEPTVERAHRGFSLIGGWAAGVKVRMAPMTFIEARFANMRGSDVKMVDKNSITIDNEGFIEFEEIQTPTDHYVYQLGVSFNF